MKAYLDNNILLYIENGTYSLSDFKSLPNTEYYYSETHIEELLNGLDRHPELKEIRLHTIEELCGSRYITPDVAFYEMEFEEQTPQRTFELSMQFKYLHDQLYNFTNAMRVDRDGFLSTLELNKNEVGNIKPSDIIKQIDEKMKEHWGYGVGIYLEKQCASTKRTVFSSLFNLLDFVCYRHDKSHTARLYDSSHACFAQMCDVLVTNDKRMKIKTEAVYSYLGINTKVQTAEVFLNL